MGNRQTDVETITTLLGQCLGRIDEQAFRLQQLDADQDDFAAADVLEHEAAQLQELVGSLVAANELVEQADLNRIVDRALRGCVAEAGIPIVSRQQLAKDMPAIACAPGQLAYAIQRAIMLGLTRLAPGGEIAVATRRDGETVLFELECEGSGGLGELQDRAASLCDFVTGFAGSCRLDIDHRERLLLVLELPPALVDQDCRIERFGG